MTRDYNNNYSNSNTEVAWTAGDEFYKHIYHLLKQEFIARSRINEFGDDHVPVAVALENWFEVLETIYNFTIDFFNNDKFEQDTQRIKEVFLKIEELSKGDSFRDFTKEETISGRRYAREISSLLMRQCARHGLLLPTKQKFDHTTIW